MKLVLLSLSLLLTASAAHATKEASGSATPEMPEATIPFVSHGAIRSWRADGNKGVWLQGSHRRWYYAKLMGPCPGLKFANALGFDTDPSGTFDRFSAVIVPDWGKCQVRSLTQSDGPPRKKDVEKAGDAAATEEESAED